MNTILEVRKGREDLARFLKNHPGIRKIVEDLYPDNAHFIYELLQNAEDAKTDQGTGATEASFILHEDRLIFEHNGCSFDKRDIEAITDIGEGLKSKEEDKIGRFGIGFKAVFAYCETPHIWSPTFSFKIESLVLPSPLEERGDIDGKTRFEFPFNNPKKNQDDAYSEIESGLNELAKTTLLFLSDLESIRWQIGESKSGEIIRTQHTPNHVEVLKQENGKKATSAHFLKFDKPVAGLTNQKVSIAYALDFLPKIKSFDPNGSLSKQFKIVPATPGHVAVFFPAKKETSGLRFHLHAPFVPELSRASIKDTPANAPLFEQLASLAASSLHDVRKHGLLKAEFLGVLPNLHDELGERYKQIRNAVICEINNKPLMPTSTKGHAPAKYLFQAKASLKSLLSKDDLGFLVKNFEGSPQWAISATRKNSNVDRFLNGLKITEWGVDKFLEAIDRKSNEYDYDDELNYFVDNLTPWLKNKTVAWHQQLYALLSNELESWKLNRVKNHKIIRLTDGTHSVGNKCFFPGNAFEENEVLPRIDAGVFTSGKSKSQKESARTFLEEIGVREVGEAEHVEAILTRRYTEEADVPDEEIYRKDFKRFVALVEEDSSAARLFAKYYIFECVNGKWSTPNRVFLDKPFLDTGLTAYFDALGDDAERFELAESYRDCGVSQKILSNFAEAVGATTQLPITETSCESNPERSYLWSVKGQRWRSSINRDYKIEGLEGLLTMPTEPLSKLIWRTMCSVSDNPYYLLATYRKNKSRGLRRADSQLVHHLKKAEWIPQNTGDSIDSICFVQPANASSDRLPKGFPYESGAHWLEKICFGQNYITEQDSRKQEISNQIEEGVRKETACKELGFSSTKKMELAKQFAESVSEEELEALIAERNKTHELPEKESKNPKLRAERVGEQATSAPDRQTGKRTRSVSVARDGVKDEAKQYLLQEYTNSDDEMFCQICKGPLPFKLDDGTEYFETTEFLKELDKHHYQNYLALCPNHSAMFRHANGSRELMAEMFDDLTEDKVELEVVLAQENTKIYFTKMHIADLRAIIETEGYKVPDN